jgi:hypothetical protein
MADLRSCVAEAMTNLGVKAAEAVVVTFEDGVTVEIHSDRDPSLGRPARAAIRSIAPINSARAGNGDDEKTEETPEETVQAASEETTEAVEEPTEQTEG